MWKAFYEHVGSCGRNGSLFIMAFLLVLGALLAGSSLGGSWLWLLWLGWLAALMQGGWRFVQTWRHPVRLGKFPPLASEDLRVARSKLVKCRVPTTRLHGRGAVTTRCLPQAGALKLRVNISRRTT